MRERERERESLVSQHSKYERSKRLQYEQRVREVEGASCVPLVSRPVEEWGLLV